jgi:hypothetical protein
VPSKATRRSILTSRQEIMHLLLVDFDLMPVAIGVVVGGYGIARRRHSPLGLSGFSLQAALMMPGLKAAVGSLKQKIGYP